jgi:rubrerythrin
VHSNQSEKSRKKEREMTELINEAKLGVAKGTDVESSVEMNFKGETAEVGLYLAMARQAYREGFPEVGQALTTIAWEEAGHAALYAELNGLISTSTRENLEKMLAGERGANKGKRESALKAKECGCDPAHDIFDESSRDEGRHARALEGLLKRYFQS